MCHAESRTHALLQCTAALSHCLSHPSVILNFLYFTSTLHVPQLDVAELEKLNNLTDTSTLAPNKRLYFPPWTSKCNNVTNQKTAVLPSGTAKACRVAQLQSGEGLYALAQQVGTGACGK